MEGCKRRIVLIGKRIMIVCMCIMLLCGCSCGDKAGRNETLLVDKSTLNTYGRFCPYFSNSYICSFFFFLSYPCEQGPLCTSHLHAPKQCRYIAQNRLVC